MGAIAHEGPIRPRQSLIVLEAAGPGPTADFLAIRGDAGVIGVSLIVSTTQPIASRVAALGLDAQWQAGPFGQSLRVPGSHAMGLHLEFVLDRSSPD